MPSRKKKFIDKKHSVTFSLVHRSQQDPETANDEASQGVLVPTARKDEQLKYGIDYDDDYNYLQHLRDVDELYNVGADVFRIGKTSTEALRNADSKTKSNLILPSNVFASPVETTIGLLNRAALDPEEEFDDDIAAALEDDLAGEDNDDFDDNFVVQLNGGDVNKEGGEFDAEEEMDDDTIKSDDHMDGGDDDDFFEEEVGRSGKKTTFTIGSIFVPESRKGTPLEALDDKFAELYDRYRNNEDDFEEEEDDEEFDDADESDEVSKHFDKQLHEMNRDDLNFDTHIDEDLKNKIMNSVSVDDNEDEKVKIKIEVPMRQWDCESILSLRSNTSHLPKTIHLPKKPTKIVKFAEPIIVEQEVKMEDEDETDEEDQVQKALVIRRDKNESKDEKKARKNAIKEDRRTRRQEKGQTKAFFKQEREKMAKQIIQQAGNFQGSNILP